MRKTVELMGPVDLWNRFEAELKKYGDGDYAAFSRMVELEMGKALVAEGWEGILVQEKLVYFLRPLAIVTVGRGRSKERARLGVIIGGEKRCLGLVFETELSMEIEDPRIPLINYERDIATVAVDWLVEISEGEILVDSWDLIPLNELNEEKTEAQTRVMLELSMASFLKIIPKTKIEISGGAPSH